MICRKQLALSCWNCSFVWKNLSLKIRVLTVLLGNDGKMTSEYKLIGCLIRSSWHAVNDPWNESCWHDLRRCNCSFIGQKLPEEIEGVMALMDNDGKMTSEYKFDRHFLEAFKVKIAIVEPFIFLYTWLLRTSYIFFKYESEYWSVSRICVWKRFHNNKASTFLVNIFP